MIASQSAGKKRPSVNVKPAGVCIQLLVERIQNEENSVPTATMMAAKKCIHRGTSSPAEQQHAEERASRKNAMRPS